MISLGLIKHLSFLHGLTDRHLQQLANLGLLQQYSAGSRLFQEKSPHHTFYLVVEGSVALDIHLPRRRHKRILTIGTGEMLAWSAILSDGRMTTSAVTLTPTQLIAWPAESLMQLCQSDHEIGFMFMQQIAQALSKRLTATRLQLLDMLGELEPVPRPGT